MKLFQRTLSGIAAAFALASAAHATPIVFNLDTSINGDTPSATDKQPWLKATFTDVMVNGSSAVELVMTNNLVNAATGTPTGEYITDWLFNIDPNLSPVTYSHVSGYNATVQYSSAGDLTGGASIKAGNFDFDFTGGTANADRFSGGMTSVYDFFGTNLTAASFAFTSSAGYYSAADVKGMVNGGSGSIGTMTYDTSTTPSGKPKPVPEPGSLMLLGLGIASLVGVKRRKTSGKQV